MDDSHVVVEDVYRILDRGTIVIGDLHGEMNAGQAVTVTRPDGASVDTLLRGFEFVRPPEDQPDRVSFLLGEEADDFVVVGTIIRGRRATDAPWIRASSRANIRETDSPRGTQGRNDLGWAPTSTKCPPIRVIADRFGALSPG